MVHLARQSTAGSSPTVPPGCLPDEVATASTAVAPLSFPATAPEGGTLTAGEISFHSLWRVLNIYRHLRSSSSTQQKPPTQLVRQQRQAHQLAAQHAARQGTGERQQHGKNPSQTQGQVSQQDKAVQQKTQRRPLEEQDAVQQSVEQGNATEGDANRKPTPHTLPATQAPCSSLSSHEDLEEEFSPRLRWDVSDGSLLLPLIPVSPEVEQYRRAYVQLHEVLMGLPPAILVSKRPHPNTLPLDTLLYNPPQSHSHLSFPRGGGKPPLSLRQLFLHVPISRREQAWLDALHAQLTRRFRPLPSCSPVGATAVSTLGCAAGVSGAAAAQLPGDSRRGTTTRGSRDAGGEAGSSETATAAADAAGGVRIDAGQRQQRQEGTHGELSSSVTAETGNGAGSDSRNRSHSSAKAETDASAARRSTASTGTDGEGDFAAAAEVLREGKAEMGAAAGVSEGATAGIFLTAAELGAGQEVRKQEKTGIENSGGSFSRPEAHAAESCGFFRGANMSRESSVESMLLDRDLLLLRGDDDDETVESLLQARAAEDVHYAAIAAGHEAAGADASAGEGGDSKRLDAAQSHGSGLLHYRSRHHSWSSKRGEAGPADALQPYPQLLEPALLRVLWLMYRSSPRKFPPPAAPPFRREEQVQQKLSGRLLQLQHQRDRRSSTVHHRRTSGRPIRRSSSSGTLQRSSGGSRDSDSCSLVSALRAGSATSTAAKELGGDAAEAVAGGQRAEAPHLEPPANEVDAVSSGAAEAAGAGAREQPLSPCSNAASRKNPSSSAAEGAGSGAALSGGSVGAQRIDELLSRASASSAAAPPTGVGSDILLCEEQVDDEGRYVDTCMTPDEEVEEAESLAVEAAAHVMKMVAFRREMFPLSDSSAELDEDLHKGVLYWTGRDVAMRPVLVLNLRRLDAALSELQRFLRLLLFVFEWGLRFMMVPGKVETCIVIFDVRNISLWSLPYKCLQVVVQTLTLQYPFRLRKMFVLHNSRLINGFWNVVKVFLTDVQQSKIAMFKVEKACKNPDLLAQVRALVPPSQLEEKYGGTREDIEEGFYPFPIAPAQPLPKMDTQGQIHQTKAEEPPLQDCWEAADALTAFGITWEGGCGLPVQWNPYVAATILKYTRTRGRVKAPLP